MDFSIVNWSSLEVDGVDPSDYPDFCDAYFSYGEDIFGGELTEDELIELTENAPATLYYRASEALT